MTRPLVVLALHVAALFAFNPAQAQFAGIDCPGKWVNYSGGYSCLCPDGETLADMNGRNQVICPGKTRYASPLRDKASGQASPCVGLDEGPCKAISECGWIVPKKIDARTGLADRPYCRRLAGVAVKKPAAPQTETIESPNEIEKRMRAESELKAADALRRASEADAKRLAEEQRRIAAEAEAKRSAEEASRMAKLLAAENVRASPGILPAGTRAALVIGNSSYTNAARLNNPARDTKAIAAALRKLGFAEVIERYDLGVQQLSAELKAFGDKAAGADWAVVYYAGHGIQVDGQTYLVPTDANLARASHAADEAVPLDRVLAKVSDARQMRLVILDACRSNPFLSRMTQAGGTRSLGRGLARVENTSGVLVAFAARDGQIADDGTDEHSPFTRALLEHIEQPGLEIGLLFRKVRDTVLKRTGGAQEPYTYGSIPSEELYFKAAAK